mmetsp:Transcript_9525/g.17907  ORF Transcript_9525/g.17907 Transcript_9525/m.17907 type:complete len:113 (+) Transcript_9525:2829-3167(+)
MICPDVLDPNRIPTLESTEGLLSTTENNPKVETSDEESVGTTVYPCLEGNGWAVAPVKMKKGKATRPKIPSGRTNDVASKICTKTTNLYRIELDGNIAKTKEPNAIKMYSGM